jgi:protein-S-isoprenylcysteine O-methyltransferase Ste14
MTRRFRPFFAITTPRHYGSLLLAGRVLIAVGFSLNLVAALAMLKAHRADRLATGGFYHLLRDPMYVLQIFITLPGLFLLFNSWLALAGVIPAYIAYRIYVREEHRYLEERFGAEYKQYLVQVLLKI